MKNMTSFHKITSWCFLLITLLASCKKEDDGRPDPCSNDFDQKTMFINLADNLIIPSYQAFQADLEKLSASARAFLDNPSQSLLATMQADFEVAYIAWQQVAPFEFGPAEAVLLRSSLNNFPVDEAMVDENISSGVYDLSGTETFYKGFPAIDYLIFGIADTPIAIVEKYLSDPLAENYRKYLNDLLDDMLTRLESTVNGWTVDGYRATFIENTGTAAGTSLSLIINHLNQHYELIKRNKLGIPSGILTLGFTNPLEVEALYSGISLELAVEALLASRRFYLGNSSGGATGQGLDDLLDHVKAEKDGQFLNQIIKDQYDTALNAIQAIPDPLSGSVDTHKEEVEKAYNETTIQVLNLKTDLPSVLCVAITYVDNPSDSD